MLLAMPTSIAATQARYLEAQIAGDQRVALRVVQEALAEGHPVHAVQRDVVQAAQLEIGRLWQENKISIAHEHMATAISQMALVHLFQHAMPSTQREHKILISCVEGELHELPARLVADYLELAGFDVRFLGANVPTASLCSVIAVERPDLLALSVTMSFNAGGLRAAITSVRERFPTLPILVGGNALAWSPELAAQLGVTTLASGSPDELVATIEGILERRA